jgi:hypothetical protein
MKRAWQSSITIRRKNTVSVVRDTIRGLGGQVETHAAGITITKTFAVNTHDRVIDEFILGLPFVVDRGLCRTSLDADDVTITQTENNGAVTLLVFFPWRKR